MFKAQQLQFFLVTSQILDGDRSFCGYKTFLNESIFPYIWQNICTDIALPSSAAWMDKKVFIYLLVCLCFSCCFGVFARTNEAFLIFTMARGMFLCS